MTLPDLRRQIDAIDEQMLKLFAERLALARQARSFKETIEDPKREDELRRIWLQHAKDLDIDPAAASALLAAVLSASRSVQSS